MERVVIVGSGQGGFQMATSLRQDGFAGSIALIGDEPNLPYQRPPLSKAYMADGDDSRILLKPESFYQRSSISIFEDRAVVIDRNNRRVVTELGKRHPYDHLVIATGARPLRPHLPGLEAKGVLELRTLSDAARLRSCLADCRHAIVIGGGFIGLEFAAVARSLKVPVTVLEVGPRLMARALSPEMSAHFLAAHREMGTEIMLNATAFSIEQVAGSVRGVVLNNGERIRGDLVLLATGVRPNVELAALAGLSISNGIVVDGHLLTSDQAISSLGDCASFPSAGGNLIRLESVQAAVDHARHISRRLVSGSQKNYEAVPWFWSDQGHLKLQIAGIGDDSDERIVVERDNRPMVLRTHGGTLSAVETVNDPGQHIAARKLVGTPIEALRASGFDLREALKGIAASVEH